MRAELRAGGILDVVSPDELHQALTDLDRRAAGRRPITVRGSEVAKLDASGDGDVDLYRVPAGMRFALHRLRIDVDGNDPGDPFTAANGWADITRGGEPLDFVAFSAAAGGLPAVYTASQAQAIDYRNGEQVTLQVHGGPASTRIVVRFQGTLQPRVET